MSRFWELRDYYNANYGPEDIPPPYRLCPICKGRGLTSHPDAHDQEDCDYCGGQGDIEVTP